MNYVCIYAEFPNEHFGGFELALEGEGFATLVTDFSLTAVTFKMSGVGSQIVESTIA